MWKGTGRSGIGDQTIIGEYEDWDGLSMNGRQYKNRLTQETRDLSGADYWHQRKALEPKMLEDIPTFINGRPNIAAFAEPVAKPKAQAKKTSAFNSIMLADRNYTRLCGLSEQLDQELDQGLIDLESWAAARRNIDSRLEKAWERLCKDRQWSIEGEELPDYTLDEETLREHSRGFKIDYNILPSDSLFSGLSDDNLFKIMYTKVLTVLKQTSKLVNVAKQIIHEGVI